MGLEVPALVVEIHNRSEPYSAAVCRAAGAVGATVLRTSSARYREFGTIREQIDAARKDARTYRVWARSSASASACTATPATS